MYRIIMSFVLLLLGIAFVAGGVRLAVLGGSLYYLIAGIAICLSGWLLLKRRSSGLTLYALTLLGTLGWALWEVGFDWWALSARESLLIVIGILLLLPPMVRSLHSVDQPPAPGGLSSRALLLVLLISAAVAGYSIFNTPHDISGSFGDLKTQAVR